MLLKIILWSVLFVRFFANCIFVFTTAEYMRFLLSFFLYRRMEYVCVRDRDKEREGETFLEMSKQRIHWHWRFTRIEIYGHTSTHTQLFDCVCIVCMRKLIQIQIPILVCTWTTLVFNFAKLYRINYLNDVIIIS